MLNPAELLCWRELNNSGFKGQFTHAIPKNDNFRPYLNSMWPLPHLHQCSQERLWIPRHIKSFIVINNAGFCVFTKTAASHVPSFSSSLSFFRICRIHRQSVLMCQTWSGHYRNRSLIVGVRRSAAEADYLLEHLMSTMCSNPLL